MKKLVVASSNIYKIKEIKEILGDIFEIITMQEIGFENDIEETGKTFYENALIKAQTIFKYLKTKKGRDCYVLADDSGLCVEALNGEPGIYSARYAHTGIMADNRKKLLNTMQGIKNRNAYFECCVVLINPSGEITKGSGKVYGEILDKETGIKDFGYDCLFYSKELQKCFGEVSREEKNAISHRGKALKNLLKEVQ